MVAHQLSVRAIDHHSADTDLLRSSTPPLILSLSLSLHHNNTNIHFVPTYQAGRNIKNSVSFIIHHFLRHTYLPRYLCCSHLHFCMQYTHTHPIYTYIVYRLSHSISVASIDSLSLFLTHLVLSSYLVCCILDCIIYQLVKYIVRVVLVRQVRSH